MELTDFLKVVQDLEQTKDALTGLDKDFKERFLNPMRTFRNHMFHHDQLPPIEKTITFWARLIELLLFLRWDTTLQRTTEITHLLDQTRAWLKKKTCTATLLHRVAKRWLHTVKLDHRPN